jgi:transcription antitermination factor NusG
MNSPSFMNLHVTEGQRSFVMFEEEKIWYVVYTIPRWEKKVVRLLTEKGIENYCPLNKVSRKWSDRTKVIMEPLFKGYVFVKIPEQKKWQVTAIPGVINFMHWLGKPAKVRDEEIQVIKRFLQDFENIEVTEYKMDVNAKVRVKGGLLMNYEGVVLEVLDNKAKVRIDSMGIQLSAVFDKKNLKLAEFY